MLSSNSTHMSHIVTGRLDVATRCQTQTTANLGAICLSGGVGGWQAPQVLSPASGFQALEVGLQ